MSTNSPNIFNLQFHRRAALRAGESRWEICFCFISPVKLTVQPDAVFSVKMPDFQSFFWTPINAASKLSPGVTFSVCFREWKSRINLQREVEEQTKVFPDNIWPFEHTVNCSGAFMCLWLSHPWGHCLGCTRGRSARWGRRQTWTLQPWRTCTRRCWSAAWRGPWASWPPSGSPGPGGDGEDVVSSDVHSVVHGLLRSAAAEVSHFSLDVFQTKLSLKQLGLWDFT